jgi:hypothetical protein
VITAMLVMLTTDAPFCWYTATAGLSATAAGCAACAITIDGLVDADRAVTAGVVADGWAVCTAHAANKSAVVAELTPATTAVLRSERTRRA